MEVQWNADESLLNTRDRLTRSLIRRDFETQAKDASVELTADLMATPVADNRYTVIWQHLGDLAIVKAVVASQFRGENAQALRDKLRRVVEAESHGRLKLE